MATFHVNADLTLPAAAVIGIAAAGALSIKVGADTKLALSAVGELTIGTQGTDDAILNLSTPDAAGLRWRQVTASGNDGIGTNYIRKDQFNASSSYDGTTGEIAGENSWGWITEARFHFGGAVIGEWYTALGLNDGSGNQPRTIFTSIDQSTTPFLSECYVRGITHFVRSDLPQWGGEFTVLDPTNGGFTAPALTGNPNLTFTAGANTIFRDAGTWSADNFGIGDEIAISGTVSNEGLRTITNIVGATATVAETLVNEGPLNGVTITGKHGLITLNADIVLGPLGGMKRVVIGANAPVGTTEMLYVGGEARFGATRITGDDGGALIFDGGAYAGLRIDLPSGFANVANLVCNGSVYRVGGNKMMDFVASGVRVYGGAGAGTVRFATDAVGLAFYNGTPRAQPTITGALLSVTDANAQAVMTSIIAALTGAAGVNLATDGTT